MKKAFMNDGHPLSLILTNRSIENFKGMNIEMLNKAFFIYFSALMALGALMWGLICLFFDAQMAAIIPFSYMGITAINFYMCNRFKNIGAGCQIQIFFTILLPFIFQFQLGGIAQSGMVMLWSLVALISALTLHKKIMNQVWLGLIVMLSSLTFLLEFSYFQSESSLNISLLAINVLAVTVILFVLSNFFINLQIKLRNSLNESREELKDSHDILQTKNSEIKESLDYAVSLQKNILPTNTSLNEAFKDFAAFFKPKDKVSGDFYWFGKSEGRKILAAVDCTGHGIPGALMSVMGYNLLNSIILNRKSIHPGVILQQLNAEVKKSLRQEFTGNHDGMDVSIISYDPVTKILEFAGAKNDLYIISKKGEVNRIKGSKSSIGGINNEEKANYCTHINILQEECIILMTSDGFIDQFGGAKGKRFMTRNFIETLESTHWNSAEEIIDQLESIFHNWKGEEVQIDDVMVVAFSINPVQEEYIPIKLFNTGLIKDSDSSTKVN